MHATALSVGTAIAGRNTGGFRKETVAPQAWRLHRRVAGGTAPPKYMTRRCKPCDSSDSRQQTLRDVLSRPSFSSHKAVRPIILPDTVAFQRRPVGRAKPAIAGNPMASVAERITMTEHAQPKLSTAAPAHRGPEGVLTAALQTWAKQEPQRVAALLERWVAAQDRPARPSP